MHERPEAELIDRSRDGDQDSIAELFRRHYPASLKLACGILRHNDDAQDAVQVAYFLAFRRLDNFRGDASFKTWISRIVVNCCLLQLREARRRVTWVQLEDRNGSQGPDIMPSHGLSPEKSAWCRELSSAFSSAVARLPRHLRETYMLFAVSGLSLREVAEAMGLSISATKTRLFRARAGLRMSLQPVWSGRRLGA
jgi:RNA polymerase sigma-70 factor (ECF subfamily)